MKTELFQIEIPKDNKLLQTFTSKKDAVDEFQTLYEAIIEEKFDYWDLIKDYNSQSLCAKDLRCFHIIIDDIIDNKTSTAKVTRKDITGTIKKPQPSYIVKHYVEYSIQYDTIERAGLGLIDINTKEKITTANAAEYLNGYYIDYNENGVPFGVVTEDGKYLEYKPSLRLDLTKKGIKYYKAIKYLGKYLKTDEITEQILSLYKSNFCGFGAHRPIKYKGGGDIRVDCSNCTPSVYCKPSDIEEVICTVTGRKNLDNTLWVMVPELCTENDMVVKVFVDHIAIAEVRKTVFGYIDSLSKIYKDLILSDKE